MEKLGDESAAKFINALIKSVQTLCHGYLDFQNGVEIIGHINLSVDKGNSLDYILKEKVCKNAENSTLFISNSFHAEPKPEQEVSGKTSQSGNQLTQNSESPDTAESGRVSSAICSISTALTESRERSRRNSGAKDSGSSHSQPNAVKRKASEEESSEFRPAKISYHDNFSHVTSESSHPQGSSSPVDSKESLLALRTADTDMSETVLPQTASVRSDGLDIGVNLAGSVLEPVEGQNNPDLQDREDDSDGDLEVTFIKEEYVEGEGPSCDFESQQFARGPQQRASDGLPDPSIFSLGPQSSSASSTYVPSAAGPQFPVGTSSSTSQPQPGPSGMRDQGENTEPWSAASWSRLLSGLPLDDIPTSIPTIEQLQLAPHLFQSQGFALGGGDSMGSISLPSIFKSPRLPRSPRPHQSMSDPSGVGAAFACSMCDAKFKTSSGLAYHERQNHKDLPQYRCPVCSKGFVSRGHFVGHMNMHNNTKTFECPVCLKTFAYMSSLKFHLKMHNNAQVFECPVCAKKFVYEKSYKMHLNTHNRANAFSCPHCPKKFAYRSSLQYHVKTGCRGGSE
ncbi:uncharacterized protein LOC143296877 isoform X1 [Babylonia areolata]|uniref:uncharacterized protein LOC143296877 isoform X1 n=1 Tax=Babylonia areolata TaxID=304850 RepID=UPI003FD63438